MGSTKLPVKCIPRTVVRGIKLPLREADHPRTRSTECENECYTSAPRYVFMTWTWTNFNFCRQCSCCRTVLPSKFFKFWFLNFLLLHFRNICPDDSCLIRPKLVNICDYNNKELCIYEWYIVAYSSRFFILPADRMDGPGGVVGITTAYGLNSPWIESRWGEIFRTCPDWPWGPPSLLYNGYRVFPGGKVRPGLDAVPSPPSSAEVKIE